MQGTFKELIEQGMKVNGVFVEQSMLSVLTRCGIGRKIGTKEKPKGEAGKAATIWEFDSQELAKIELSCPQE